MSPSGTFSKISVSIIQHSAADQVSFDMLALQRRFSERSDFVVDGWNWKRHCSNTARFARHVCYRAMFFFYRSCHYCKTLLILRMDIYMRIRNIF